MPAAGVSIRLVTSTRALGCWYRIRRGAATFVQGLTYACARLHLPVCSDSLTRHGEKSSHQGPSDCERPKVQWRRRQSSPFPSHRGELKYVLRVVFEFHKTMSTWGLRCSCRSVRNLAILFLHKGSSTRLDGYQHPSALVAATGRLDTTFAAIRLLKATLI